MKNYIAYFQGSLEVEPNAVTQENGPIVSGTTCFGALPSGDPKDYFYITLTDPHTVEAWLTNIPSGQDDDLVLRDNTLSQLIWANNIGNSDEHILSAVLQSGKYYVQVVPAAGSSESTGVYQLNVVYH